MTEKGEIDKTKCTRIGTLLKTHGSDGRLLMSFEEGYSSFPENTNYLFIEIDGGLVPFFIAKNGINTCSHKNAIITFDTIDTREKAKKITGSHIYLLSKNIIKDTPQPSSLNFKGYTVVDTNHGNIGSIHHVNNYSGNKVAYIINNESEIMIPLSDDIIKRVCHEKKELYLECPKGLPGLP